MVLESLVSAEDAEKHPWKIAALSFVFAFVAVYAALYSGFGSKGVIVVAVASVASIPFITGLFNFGESWYEHDNFMGSTILARHFPVVVVLAAFFIGILAGFYVAQLTLSSAQASAVFDIQINEVQAVTSTFSGHVTDYAQSVDAFELLFLHNLQVLILIIAASVIYGAGAVVIIVWNASVIGVFLNAVANTVGGADKYTAALAGISIGVLGIIPHGSFELLAYLTGALAGGILSTALVRRHHLHESFILVMHDVAKLFAIAVIFLAIAAAIESQAVASII